MQKDSIVSQRWDEEYERGRYENEPPTKFVGTIMQTLDSLEKSNGSGLYVGCGNGRNYVPLIAHGLDIFGIDISAAAIDRLKQRATESANRLECVGFLDFNSALLFDYIIAIQVFQHGTWDEISKYFAKTSGLLKSDGLLFLSVNSVSTDIYHKHTIVEETSFDGKTVLYTEGPKKDINIHFYSRQELDVLSKEFEYVILPYENKTIRTIPGAGTWSQWELVLRKK